MQVRGPKPNGMNCVRAYLASRSGAKRSGSKRSGSSHSLPVAVHGEDGDDDRSCRPLIGFRAELDVLGGQARHDGRRRIEAHGLLQHRARDGQPLEVLGADGAPCRRRRASPPGCAPATAARGRADRASRSAPWRWSRGRRRGRSRGCRRAAFPTSAPRSPGPARVPAAPAGRRPRGRRRAGAPGCWRRQRAGCARLCVGGTCPDTTSSRATRSIAAAMSQEMVASAVSAASQDGGRLGVGAAGEHGRGDDVEGGLASCRDRWRQWLPAARSAPARHLVLGRRRHGRHQAREVGGAEERRSGAALPAPAGALGGEDAVAQRVMEDALLERRLGKLRGSLAAAPSRSGPGR